MDCLRRGEDLCHCLLAMNAGEGQVQEKGGRAFIVVAQRTWGLGALLFSIPTSWMFKTKARHPQLSTHGKPWNQDWPHGILTYASYTWSQGQKGPTLELMLNLAVLRILTILGESIPLFHCASAPTNYVVSPVRNEQVNGWMPSLASDISLNLSFPQGMGENPSPAGFTMHPGITTESVQRSGQGGFFQTYPQLTHALNSPPPTCSFTAQGDYFWTSKTLGLCCFLCWNGQPIVCLALCSWPSGQERVFSTLESLPPLQGIHGPSSPLPQNPLLAFTIVLLSLWARDCHFSISWTFPLFLLHNRPYDWHLGSRGVWGFTRKDRQTSPPSLLSPQEGTHWLWNEWMTQG